MKRVSSFVLPGESVWIKEALIRSIMSGYWSAIGLILNIHTPTYSEFYTQSMSITEATPPSKVTMFYSPLMQVGVHQQFKQSFCSQLISPLNDLQGCCGVEVGVMVKTAACATIYIHIYKTAILWPSQPTAAPWFAACVSKITVLCLRRNKTWWTQQALTKTFERVLMKKQQLRNNKHSYYSRDY